LKRNSSSSLNSNKKIGFDLGCIVIGDNNGMITVYSLPEPKDCIYDG
jgi:hypothetical protein